MGEAKGLDRSEKELATIIAQYHLDAESAIAGRIKHYPSIVETVGKISAIFPGEKAIRKDERIEIGLQIQQRWSKATSDQDYSAYKLVALLGDIITKLNKGIALTQPEESRG